MATTRQEKDLELWKSWRKTGNNQDLQRLMNNLQPLLYRETNKWQGTVPPAALEARGKILMLEALKSYNPNRGAAVATHITSRLRKISRDVYPHQNIARLPENKQLQYNTFNIAKTKLEEEFGREPTHDEMADELKWTPKKVWDFERSFGRKEYVESEGSVFESGDSSGSLLIDFFYRDLAPKDKVLFEDITGYGGKRVLNNTALKSKHNMTQGQLSYKKRQFSEQVKRVQKGF